MPRVRSDFLEIGKTGLNWSAGYIYDEFLSALRGKRGVRTYREMKDNDAIVGSVLFAITQILREAKWDVQVPDGGKEEDAEFLRSNMTGMTHSWMDFYTETLSMLPYGWSWFEQVYYRRPDNKIGWKKMAPRKQISMEKWEMSPVGETLGMWQRPPPDYQLYYLPIEKSLHFRTEPNGNNPEGRSIMRSAFRPWFFKKNIEEIEGIGIERDLTGLPVLKLPEGLNPNSDDTNIQVQITAAKRLISNVRRDEQDGIILPFGWEFDLLASKGTRQFDTSTIVNRFNKEIAVTVLAQFVMLGMERTGSYALAKEQTDMFYQCLEGWIDVFMTTVNRHAVSKLFLLNGVIDRPLPYVVHTPIRRFNLKDLADYVAKLGGDKVNALDIDADVKSFLARYARLKEYSEVRK